MAEHAVWLTAKVKGDLARIARENGITEEAIANVILRLSFSDEAEVKRVINLTKATNLGGATDLTNKGW